MVPYPSRFTASPAIRVAATYVFIYLRQNNIKINKRKKNLLALV